MKVIDMHTHIFPEKIAAKATIATAEYFDLPEPPNHYGSVNELLEVLGRAHIDYAMVFSAATTAHQVEHINRYILSETEAHPGLIPCGTLHAGYEGYREELQWMREHGIYGVKLHPEFQHFALDDERLFPMFEEMERQDMFLIAAAFPRLRCIAAHLGNWGDWDVEKIRPLAKLPNVYTDISSSFSYVADKAPLYPILREYDPTHVFWGSDYPIWCPQKELDKALALGLEQTFLEDVLFNNFAAFYHYRKL